MALWSWWQRAAEETAQSWCKFGCWILSWHSKDNRFFSTTGNTCRKGTDVATSSMPWKSMCQGLGSVYCPLCVCAWTHFSHVNSLWPYGLLPAFVMGILWESWSGLPCPLPGYVPCPGIEPMSSAAPALQGGSLLLSHWGSPYCPLSRLNSVNKVCLSS